MQVTSSTASSTANSSANPLTGSSQTLNQKDFLQLLVTQMQNQNPLNPQSDTQMAAQMAQFTSLQQSSSMASSLDMMQANSLVGSTVNVQVDSKTIDNGVVEGVVLQGGTPHILINGTPYNVSQVISVAPTAPNPAAAGQSSTTP